MGLIPCGNGNRGMWGSQDRGHEWERGQRIGNKGGE